MDYAPLADGGPVQVMRPIDISLVPPPTYSKKEQTMQLKTEPIELEMEQSMDIDEKFHKENKFTDFITVCCTIEGENQFLIFNLFNLTLFIPKVRSLITFLVQLTTIPKYKVSLLMHL